jgi:hypothetical protein
LFEAEAVRCRFPFAMVRICSWRRAVDESRRERTVRRYDRSRLRGFLACRSGPAAVGDGADLSSSWQLDVAYCAADALPIRGDLLRVLLCGEMLRAPFTLAT